MDKAAGQANDTYNEMCVMFAIEKSRRKILEGSFLVTPAQGISYVGENHPVEFAYDKDHKYTTGVFKGAVIQHVLGAESASISLTMLDAKPDPTSPFEVKQVVVLQTGMEMGIFSGSKTQDSIMLDPEHVFIFRTILARKRK
jgi:hypothetical protein